MTKRENGTGHGPVEPAAGKTENNNASGNDTPASTARKGLLKYALEYAKYGWRVFPLYQVDQAGCECRNTDCDKAGKHPAIKKWPELATIDREQIKKWWTDHPDRGIGIATGEESNLTVLDVDGSAGAIALGKLAGPAGMPPTVVARTGRDGGMHYYFQYASGIKSEAGKLGKGLDTRSDGGYVVAPPSLHASGKHYAWAQPPSKTALAEWPDFLSGEEKPPEKGKRGAPPKETFNPASERDKDQIKLALSFLNPDDEERWAHVGWIMGRAFHQSDEGFAMYSAWAGRSRKYDKKRTKGHYYERSKEDRGNKVETTKHLYDWAVEGGMEPPEEGHWPLAAATIARLREEHDGNAPVYALGKLWVTQDKLWVPMELRQVSIKVGEWYHREPFCKKATDFRQIAQLAADKVTDDDFFQQAIVGVAGPKNLYVIENGEIRIKPLHADHRLRIRVNAEPNINGESKLFKQLLTGMFSDNAEQLKLCQILFGAGMMQMLWKFQIVVLLYGLTGAGKSTLLKIYRSLFPVGVIAAVGPQKWGNEYYVAELAGKLINLVGELDKKEFIPTGGFKIVTGEDLATGRNPYGLPFHFTSTCSHFFNSNSLPLTQDHSDAFYRRWRILEFTHTTPEEKRIQNLADQIIEREMAYVVAWLLEGARIASTLTKLPETEEHKQLLKKWRNANNSALQFVNDPAHCIRGKEYGPTTGARLFNRYADWAVESRLLPFGRNKFYEALVEGGLRRTDPDHQPLFHDIALMDGGNPNRPTKTDSKGNILTG